RRRLRLKPSVEVHSFARKSRTGAVVGAAQFHSGACGYTILSRIAAILPAAGLGTRMGAETPKQFLELDGVPIVILSVRRIASCDLITEIIVATRAAGVAKLEERIAAEKFKQKVRVVRGGDSRQESVAAALNEVANDTELVAVQEPVRPFVTREQIVRVIEEARRCRAAILGIPAM